jgi:hypothetical protein
MNGFRIKHTFTFSAAGQMAPVYTTVAGLSEKEMPEETCPSGMFAIKIPGLAVGSDVDPSNNLPGYVVFLRKTGDNSLDRRRHQHYRESVFLPFVEKVRNQWDNHVPGTEVPEHLTAVSYCDSDLAQMAVVTDGAQMKINEEVRIVLNKQSAARSGTEQAADLCALFRLLKAHGKITTCAAMTPLKRRVSSAMLDLKDVVILPKAHCGALIDHVSTLPGILQKIATKKIIQSGFVAAGLIDEKSFSVPDLAAIMRTTRRTLGLDEERNFLDQFPLLLNVQYENGHLSDAVMEKHGLPIDIDGSGKEVRRESTISGESFQRSKNLTHKIQCQLRQDVNDQILAKKSDKLAKATLETEQLYLLNKDCEESLLKALRKALKQPDGELSLELATIDLFAKPTSPLLKAFYEVRKGKPEAGWPNKGQAKDAQNGSVNLILLAFGCRCDSVVEATVAPELVETAAEEIVPVPFETFEAAPMNLATCRFVVTDQWIEKCKLAFNPEQMVHFADHSAATLQSHVDTLVKILWSRLLRHINYRVHESKRGSWVWNFVKENLGPVAAMMILVGHVQSHLLGIVNHSHVCLLRNPVGGGNMIPLTGENGSRTNAAKSLQGCYLHFDVEKGIWIRSGKATGQPFDDRLRQHDKGAKLRDEVSLKSKFYSHYPSKEAQIDTSTTRFGYYEDLGIYCGLCFVESELLTNHDEGSIFKWSSNSLKRLGKLSWNGAKAQKKRVHMVGYLVELVYDLSIARAHNISGSPGFELPLGAFPAKKR